MHSCVILLRGINVGGKNRLPMVELRETLATLGCEDVATYIQSGNAVCRFEGDLQALSANIASTIKKEFDFEPGVLVLDGSAFREVVSHCPFTIADAKHFHVWFLKQVATDVDTVRLEELAAKSEEFELTSQAFYLHAPTESDDLALPRRSKRPSAYPVLHAIAAPMRSCASSSIYSSSTQ